MQMTQVQELLDALTKGIYWSIGFDHPKFDALCYCPCNNNMLFWRAYNKISLDVVSCGMYGRLYPKVMGGHIFATSKLVEHLEEKQAQCIAHRATYEYLKSLYSPEGVDIGFTLTL